MVVLSETIERKDEEWTGTLSLLLSGFKPRLCPVFSYAKTTCLGTGQASSFKQYNHTPTRFRASYSRDKLHCCVLKLEAKLKRPGSQRRKDGMNPKDGGNLLSLLLLLVWEFTASVIA